MKHIFSFLFLALLFSCGQYQSGELVQSSWLDAESFDAFIAHNPESLMAKKAAHGGVGMKTQINIMAITWLNQPYPYHDVSAGVYDLSTNNPINDLSISVSGIPLVQRENGGMLVGEPVTNASLSRYERMHYAEEWFGDSVSVRILDESGKLEVETMFYVPEELIVSGEFAREGYLTVGDKLFWNPALGCPTLLLNASVLPSEKHDGETYYKEIDNSGEYLITEEDLKDFPRNELVLFSIMQGNFQNYIGLESEESFRVSARSQVVERLMVAE